MASSAAAMLTARNQASMSSSRCSPNGLGGAGSLAIHAVSSANRLSGVGGSSMRAPLLDLGSMDFAISSSRRFCIASLRFARLGSTSVIDDLPSHGVLSPAAQLYQQQVE